MIFFGLPWYSLAPLTPAKIRPPFSVLPASSVPVFVHHRVNRIVAFSSNADGLPVVDLAQAVLVLETQAVVERELRIHAPVVLEVAAPIAREPLAVAVDRAGADPVDGRPSSRLAISWPPTPFLAGEQRVEIEAPAELRFRWRARRPAAEIGADLEAVAADSFVSAPLMA